MGSHKQIKKIVLAYSGGLDTSVIVKWLIDKYSCEVIAYCGDVGQGADLSPLEERAKKTGASKLLIEDLREDFAQEYLLPALQLHALYEGQYDLATALNRPLIAKRLVDFALSEGADAIAHGCTGKGNDQVRFEATINALAPQLTILAPVREWELTSRESEIAYAEKHNIPIEISHEKIYSIDKCLWGISIECGPLEDPYLEPPRNTYITVKHLDETPDTPEYLELDFEKGVPQRINGKAYSLVDLIVELNKVGGNHGVGRIDMIENRLVGIKSREVYETPAGSILIKAHRDLESLVLDREMLHYKENLTNKFSELVYYGLWFSTLRESIVAFNDVAQQYVTGTVRLKLFKGQATVVGRKSKNSLYLDELSTYAEHDKFDQSSSKGFIDLWTLPLKVAGQVRKK
ncbi:MAG: argininosuccinate synthase [bacterium]|nr:argininosuccinate synthase [bacterium]